MPWLLIPATLLSCSSSKTLTVRNVGYQAIRTEFAQPETIPDKAEIAVVYIISESGKLTTIVKNLTSEVMVIDKTKSFFIDCNGVSTPYYDPTIKTSSSTAFSSTTGGTAMNLGGMASLFGIGGPIGSMLGSITVSNSSTDGSSSTNTTIKSDLPKISIGPKGSQDLHWEYRISGVGVSALASESGGSVFYSKETSPLKFSVCVSYSTDGGETFKLITTPFYVCSMFKSPVSNGKVNDAFRAIYSRKPDALNEPVYIFSLDGNIAPGFSSYRQGLLIDFQ